MTDDPLPRYRAKVKADVRLRDFVYDLYRQHWPFIRRLPCSEKTALYSYKQDSSVINAILWLPEDVESLKVSVANYLTTTRASVPFFRQSAIEWLEKELSTITRMEKIFSKAPRLSKALTVFRGVSKKHSGGYTELKVGDRVTPKSFVSTTFNFDVAMMFSKFVDVGLVLQIKLSKGTPHILVVGNMPISYPEATTFTELMKDKNYGKDEMELLLNKNTVFELVSIEKTTIASSMDYGAPGYKKLRRINILTLQVVGSEDKKFEMKAEDIADKIASVTFQINKPPPTSGPIS